MSTDRCSTPSASGYFLWARRLAARTSRARADSSVVENTQPHPRSRRVWSRPVENQEVIGNFWGGNSGRNEFLADQWKSRGFECSTWNYVHCRKPKENETGGAAVRVHFRISSPGSWHLRQRRFIMFLSHDANGTRVGKGIPHPRSDLGSEPWNMPTQWPRESEEPTCQASRRTEL